jgi:hypothetical protein
MKTNRLFSAAFALLATLTLSCEEGLNVDVTSKLSNPRADATKGSGSAISFMFTGQESDAISLETAKNWTEAHQASGQEGPRAHFFGSAIIKQILSQEGCVGIRAYYSLDESGTKQLILVGVTADGNNMLPSSLQLNPDDPNTIADASWPCPTYCPPTGIDF